MHQELHPADSGFATAADGTRIFWTAVGHGGPTLVCCDGIGCDGFAWKYLVRDFAPTHRIIRWHYRGHRRSGGPRDRTKVRFHGICGDMAARPPATETEPPVLARHSLR